MILCFSNLNTLVIVISGSQDISTQFTFYNIIYTNYDKKSLVRIKKPEISQNKFKGQPFKEGQMVSLGERGRK